MAAYRDGKGSTRVPWQVDRYAHKGWVSQVTAVILPESNGTPRQRSGRQDRSCARPCATRFFLVAGISAIASVAVSVARAQPQSPSADDPPQDSAPSRQQVPSEAESDGDEGGDAKTQGGDAEDNGASTDEVGASAGEGSEATGLGAKESDETGAATPEAGDPSDDEAASGKIGEAPSRLPSAASAGSLPSATQAPSSQQSAAVSAGEHEVALRQLQERVQELKDQVFRSKSRLALLAESVLGGVVGGAQTRVTYRNEMSRAYRLVRAIYALDGAPVFTRADEEGVLPKSDSVDVYTGSVVPGEHTLTVTLEYRGHGYGVFAYLNGYRFKVHSTYTFTAPASKSVAVNVLGYEKGGPVVPMEERPAIRFATEVSSIRNEVARNENSSRTKPTR